MKKIFPLLIGTLLCLVSCGKKNINTIVLNGNPSTGYIWHHSFDDNSIVKIEEKFEPLAQGKTTGAPGRFVYTFKGLKTGKTILTFEYRRPWEINSTPSNQIIYSVQVDEDLNVNVSEQ